jgi:hypothetical protein
MRTRGLSDVEKSKRNTIWIETNKDMWEPIMIDPRKEPINNVIWEEDVNGNWVPRRRANYV